jgi:phosphate transport system protein
MTGEHLSKQYDADLEEIRSKVLGMGGIVERQFNDAINAFRLGTVSLAEKVIAEDAVVNQLEIDLDDACSHLIVRRQPTANDLRTVMATIKIITDLERMGDEAVKIARHAVHMHAPGIQKVPHDATLQMISAEATDMLRSALDAFARLDEKQAVELIAQDVGLDEGFRSIVRSLMAVMIEDSRAITNAIDTLWVAKAVERVGDHAKNIGEYVVYVVGGKDIRHSDFALQKPIHGQAS